MRVKSTETKWNNGNKHKISLSPHCFMSNILNNFYNFNKKLIEFIL